MAVPQAIAPSSAETPLEAHLRRVIESQPVCLTRLAEDGTFLAVNEAALHLLGAERLDQVLSTSLLTLLEPEFHDDIQDFLKRMAGGERGSIEVVMTALEGPPRTMQVHGVGMTTPIDGLRSVLCTLRDVTESRRLEQALVDGALREDTLRAALAAGRDELETALAQARTHEAAPTDTRRLAELQAQLAAAAAQYADREAALRADLEALRTSLESAAADHLARVAEADAARNEAETRLREAAERHKAEEARWHGALDEASGSHGRELKELRAAIASLEATVQEATARERDLVALYEAEKTTWQQAADDASAERERQIAELRADLSRLEQALEAAAARERDAAAVYEAEKVRWQQRLDEAAAAHRRELEERCAATAALETTTQEAVARERDVIALYEADKARWQQGLEEAAATHRRELEDSRVATAALEAAARDAAARERDAIALYEAEKARWQRSLEETAAARRRELEESRAATAALEATAQEAAAREHDAIALYEAEKARWQQALEEALAAHRRDAEEARLSVAALEAAAAAAVTRERETAARHAADEAGWRKVVEQAERTLAAAKAESRALEAQWQHASRLANAARLTASVASELETALAMATAGARRLMTTVPDGDARTLAEQALGASLEATLLARELRRHGVPPPVIMMTPAVQRLEPVLRAMLQPDVTLAVLAGSGDVDASIQPADLEHVLMLLVTAERSAMRHGGTVSLEIAEVTIDETVARERGVRPGGYALLAFHTEGPGLETELPAAVFETFVPVDAWTAAGPAFAAVHRLVAAASGHVWASREGKQAVALELYLPRAAATADATREVRA